MKRRVVQEEPEEEFEDDSDIDLDEDDSDLEEDSDEDEDEYTDMASVLEGLLTTDEDNVCTAMLRISDQLKTTNTLLIKLVTHLTKAPPAPTPTPVVSDHE